MPTKASSRGSWALQEEVAPYGKPSPASKPQILVLEERSHALYEPARLLESAGYPVQTLFEEAKIVAKILAAESKHFVLLTAHNTGYPLRVPQIVEDLRRGGYERLVACCVKGRVSSDMKSAYEALTIGRVLSLPSAVRSSALESLAWAGERVDWNDGGITILEV